MDSAHGDSDMDASLAELYATLPLTTDNQIRLIRIVPGNGRKSIHCELGVVSLASSPDYVALSYTWGPAVAITQDTTNNVPNSFTHRIFCRSRSGTAESPWLEYFVTPNLHAFLMNVQSDDKLVQDLYWIDAICINQTNPAERTAQVRLMGSIYRSAKMVYAWLGEADADTPQTFDLIRALAAQCLGEERHVRIQTLSDITPAALRGGTLTARLGVRADFHVWRALARFFDRRYFTRIWTIQEITLAKTLVAHCGDNQIDWNDIVKVSEFLTMSTWTKWLESMTNSRANYHSVPNLVDANKSSQNMLYSLIRFRRFSCVDPRDKVYGLLSLAGNSVQGRRRFAPIYGHRSPAETYTLAAIQMLEDSSDLLLLACAEGDTYRTIPSLPSWVPDWSCSHSLGLGVTGYKRYSAAGTIPRMLEIDEWSRSITIKGFRLDDIALSGESKSEVMGGTPFFKWLAILNEMSPIYHTGQSRSEVFWRSLISDTAGVPPCFPAPAKYRAGYQSWIIDKILALSKDNGRDSTMLQAFDNAMDLFSVREVPEMPKAEQNNDANGAEVESVDLHDFETIFSYSRHLRPFLTNHRYLGVGSASLCERDSVWIIAGSRVPLILRQVSASSFRIVGGAYMHGFMKAEALAANPIFSTITIL